MTGGTTQHHQAPLVLRHDQLALPVGGPLAQGCGFGGVEVVGGELLVGTALDAGE